MAVEIYENDVVALPCGYKNYPAQPVMIKINKAIFLCRR